MSTQQRISVLILVASLIVLVVVAGARIVSTAQALAPAQQLGMAGVTIPYLGRLDNDAGQAVSDGTYDFIFTAYTAETGGEPVWMETQEGVAVSAGTFAVSLGSVNPIPQEALDGSKRWLDVAVRGAGETEFTALTPRQILSMSAPATPSSPAAGPACAHDHVGEVWNASVGWSWSDTPAFKVINNLNGPTIWGMNTGGGNAIRGDGMGSGSIGVYGDGDTGVGVAGYSASATGVNAYGGGSFHENAALRANNSNTTNGVAAWFSNNSGWPTVEIDQGGSSGRVLDLQNSGTGDGTGSGDFIVAYNSDPIPKQMFRVGGKGDVWAKEGLFTIGADMAEMLPAVPGLEPGDVLAIGLDGQLTLTTQAYQASVIGVYSTDPGFVGGDTPEGENPGAIPLAVVGVVPVKVTAENGPILPGDLLVAASTPGYAMKAGANPPQGTVIGKALGGLDEGTGVIKMLATLQ